MRLMPLPAALLLLLPQGVEAQVAAVVGGAASIPLAGYAEVTKLGGQGQVGLQLGLGGGATVTAQGFYDVNPHRIAGDRSHVYGLDVLVGYDVGSASGMRLTPRAGIGGVVHSSRSEGFPGLNASRRGLTLTLGATVARQAGRLRPFLSWGYARGLGDLGSDSFPTEWMTIGLGLEIPLALD